MSTEESSLNHVAQNFANQISGLLPPPEDNLNNRSSANNQLPVSSASLLPTTGQASAVGALPFSPFRSAATGGTNMAGLSTAGLFSGAFPAAASAANLNSSMVNSLTAALSQQPNISAGSVIRPTPAIASTSLNYTRPIIRQYSPSEPVGLVLGAAHMVAGLPGDMAADNAHAQKLKVEDALSYLDQVKVQFANRPQVYSDFLDIMKDFKSQAIDTPGVIQRVSSLFRGRGSLIVGFNTFLPPGFRIEVTGDRITICTPNGEHRVISDLQGREVPASGVNLNNNNNSNTNHLQQQHVPNNNNNSNQSMQANALNIAQQAINNANNMNNNNPAPPQVAVNAANNQRQAIEFNHAISYVNKIKNRFHNQPDVYKQFLEILHSYQKEQRDLKANAGARPTLSESEVYQSVSRLFADEPDLLREFSQFLPDATPAHVHAQLQAQAQQQQQLMQAANNQSVNSNNNHAANHNQSIEPMPTAATTSNMTSANANVAAPQTDKSRHVNGTKPAGSNMNNPAQIKQSDSPQPLGDAVQAPKTQGESAGAKVQKRQASPARKEHTPPVKRPKETERAVELEYDVPLGEAAKYGTMQEYEFFDKVRRVACGNEKVVYENFLRCFALYNQDMISKTELLDLVRPFLSKQTDLQQWLKQFLGCNERAGYVESMSEKQVVIDRAQQHINSDLAMQIDYATCKRNGVSYRALPASYQQPKCSGRDETCNETLNDEWVSFPSWSEGDTGCVSSKKTQYEEFIYRTEDERFELDIVIETNHSAVLVLESVQRAQKGTSHAIDPLEDNLSSQTPGPLLLKAFKRIYGDKANDILNGLRRNPLVAVPLILKRLKAKDLEWREAQKNFNQIWREQNDKYYLKSLDHQGIASKQNDQKQLRSKSLLNQIETLYDERRERVEEAGESLSGPHLTFDYSQDTELIHDVSDLILHHVRRLPNTACSEKRKMKRVMKLIVPQIFNVHPEPLSDDEDDEQQPSCSDDNQSDSESKPANGGRKRNARACKQNNTNNANAPKLPQKRLMKPKLASGHSVLYGTNAWYIFLRLHHIMCERLHQLKQYAQQQCTYGNGKGERPLTAAEALHVTTKSRIEPAHYYSHLLKSIKDLLDNQLDTAAYEDKLREMFTIKAFLAFTMDKFIPNMTKQLQTIVTDDLNVKVLSSMEQFMASSTELAQNSIEWQEKEASYLRHSETLLTDHNMFKTQFQFRTRTLCFELLDTDTAEDAEENTTGVLEEGNQTPSTAQVTDTVATVDSADNDKLMSCFADNMPGISEGDRQVKMETQSNEGEDAGTESRDGEDKLLQVTLADRPRRFLMRNASRVRAKLERASLKRPSPTATTKKDSPAPSTSNSVNPTDIKMDVDSSNNVPATSSGASCSGSMPATNVEGANVQEKANGLQVRLHSVTGARLAYVAGTTDAMARHGAPAIDRQAHAFTVRARSDRMHDWHQRTFSRLVTEQNEHNLDTLNQTHDKWMRGVGLDGVRSRLSARPMLPWDYLTHRHYATESKRTGPVQTHR